MLSANFLKRSSQLSFTTVSFSETAQQGRTLPQHARAYQLWQTFAKAMPADPTIDWSALMRPVEVGGTEIELAYRALADARA